MPFSPRHSVTAVLTALSRRVLRLGQWVCTASLACVVMQPASARGQLLDWSNFAGTPGGSGTVDGTASAARFSGPSSMAADSTGNLFIADTGNNTIRKVTTAGVVTTLAGSAGLAGSADGTGSTARFNGPSAVAVDTNGNVYVADTYNDTIRKITTAGVVTTVAGAPSRQGSADGLGSVARFSLPQGLALDAAGNLYIADFGNSTIRKMTPAGLVSTLAGSPGALGSADGLGSIARFNFPVALTADTAGNLWVADTYNHKIRKVTPAGAVTTLAGTGQAGNTDGPGVTATFHYLSGIVLAPGGDLFIADTYNNTLRRVTAAGVVSTVAGMAGLIGHRDGLAAQALFYRPSGVALDPGGNIFVVEESNHLLRKLSTLGDVTTFAGAAGWGSADGTGSAAQFQTPTGVAVDSGGNVYVADTTNHTVRKITAAGTTSTLAGSVGQPGHLDGIGAAARFAYPSVIAVGSTGNVYVGDSEFGIRKITPGGEVTTLGGGVSGSPDGIVAPGGLAVDASGNVYVSDPVNNSVRKVTPAGLVTTLASSANGILGPSGIAVDSSGTVYVATTNSPNVRTISPAGAVGIFAPGVTITSPCGLTLDGAGNVYIVNQSQTLRKITPFGAIVTLGGSFGVATSVDGLGTLSRFSFPQGVAVGPDGALYLADTENQRISRGAIVDGITQPPALASPASAGLFRQTIPITFTIPEQALVSSVRLNFAGIATRNVTLASSQEAAGMHSFNIDVTQVGLSPEVASISPSSSIPDGIYLVTLSYQDQYGNATAAASATNVRIDTTPPTFNLPGNLTIPPTSPSGAVVNYTAGATDAGGSGVSSVSFTPASGSLFPIGTTTVNANATDNAGNVATSSFTVTIPPLTPAQNWRWQYFSTVDNAGAAADAADPDGDGLNNLLEFATHSDPTARNAPAGHLIRNGSVLEFTYLRAKAAVTAGVSFAVEWSDDLALQTWSTSGVSESVLSEDSVTQNMKATVPAGTIGQRFVRLEVTPP